MISEGDSLGVKEGHGKYLVKLKGEVYWLKCASQKSYIYRDSNVGKGLKWGGLVKHGGIRGGGKAATQEQGKKTPLFFRWKDVRAKITEEFWREVVDGRV